MERPLSPAVPGDPPVQFLPSMCGQPQGHILGWEQSEEMGPGPLGLTQLTGEARVTVVTPAGTGEEVTHEGGGRASSQELTEEVLKDFGKQTRGVEEEVPVE